ncbi:hypothetical protein QBC38DRAFT_483387 [Podospora fimiseda]|uniref:Rhodopsin domain-containing protein n=1 Tax=Podospora fimiseda TaxID=252190 RepID=A0AAN7BLB7_9PEZI|nr:hypothetical protein QBC38DRAFT_483387 [Podospora fimiseda]
MSEPAHNVEGLNPKDTLHGLLGVYDNLNDPVPDINKPERMIGLCISFGVMAWLCVAFRLFTRFKIVKAAGLDDLFVVLSAITMTAALAAICVATKYGLGEHYLKLNVEDASNFLKTLYVFNGTYCISTALIKISLLLQYMRLYERGTILFSVCRYLMIIVSLWGIAYSAIAWVPCSPVDKYWWISFDENTTEVKCYGYGSQNVAEFKATYESHAALNMLFDLLVMVLPIPLYFNKDAPVQTKRGLIGIVVMGSLVNIFSIWRFATTIKHQVTTYPTFDPTFYLPITAVMAGLELAAACICASIPVFWGPLIQHASQYLGIGNIFVTHEVKVETEHRFKDLGSRDQFADMEMQNPSNHSRSGSEANLAVPRSESRMEWVDKTGLQQSYQTWEQKTPTNERFGGR